MSILPDKLIPVFSELEERSDPFAENVIAHAIWSCCDAQSTSAGEVPIAATWERMAFDFIANPDDVDESGRYFGAFKDSRNGVVWPNPASITPEILNYWTARSREAKHPLLRARYADLAWDMAAGVAGARREVASAQIAIDSYCELIDRGLCDDPSEAGAKAERAINLAFHIQDKDRIVRVRDAVLKLDSLTAEFPYGAGTAFEFLLIDHKNIPLAPNQCETLVKSQEAMLAKTVEYSENLRAGQLNLPIKARNIGIRLAKYYGSKNRQDEVRRVLGLYARAYIGSARVMRAIEGAAWLREAYELLTDFGCTLEAEKVGVVLNNIAANSRSQMISFQDQIEITKQEAEDWANPILAESLDNAFSMIVGRFIPDRSRMQAFVMEIAERAPLSAMLATTHLDSSGRAVATIGSVEDDLDGRVLCQIAEKLQVDAPFLRYIFVRLIERYKLGPERLTAEIFKSPIFQPDRGPTIRSGVDAWFGGDHVVAAHLLMPQIEHALRTLVVTSGGNPYKPKVRRGGNQYKILDDLIREEVVVRTLGENIIPYFRVVLTESCGWNLRNDLFHGIIDPAQLTWASSDRLLHLLLTLSRVRTNNNNASGPENSSKT